MTCARVRACGGVLDRGCWMLLLLLLLLVVLLLLLLLVVVVVVVVVRVVAGCAQSSRKRTHARHPSACTHACVCLLARFILATAPQEHARVPCRATPQANMRHHRHRTRARTAAHLHQVPLLHVHLERRHLAIVVGLQVLPLAAAPCVRVSACWCVAAWVRACALLASKRTWLCTHTRTHTHAHRAGQPATARASLPHARPWPWPCDTAARAQTRTRTYTHDTHAPILGRSPYELAMRRLGLRDCLVAQAALLPPSAEVRSIDDCIAGTGVRALVSKQSNECARCKLDKPFSVLYLPLSAHSTRAHTQSSVAWRDRNHKQTRSGCTGG